MSMAPSLQSQYSRSSSTPPAHTADLQPAEHTHPPQRPSRHQTTGTWASSFQDMFSARADIRATSPFSPCTPEMAPREDIRFKRLHDPEQPNRTLSWPKRQFVLIFEAAETPETTEDAPQSTNNNMLRRTCQ